MAPLLDCMGAIASALSEPCAWHQALDELRAPFASDACALARYHLGRRQGEYLIRNRLRADLDDGAPPPLAPPWLERLRPGAVPGDAWLDRALITREELLASDFYRDWLAPDGLAHLSCGIVWRAGDVVITLEHFRRQGRPPFGHRHLMIHDLFLPRLGQAFELCRLLHAGPDDPDVLARALRPMAAAVVVADGAGRVMAASEAAQRTVVVDAAGEGDALPVAVAGASPLLHDAVASAAVAADRGEALPRLRLALHQLPDGSQVSAEVAPLPSSATARVGVVLQPTAAQALGRERWQRSVMTTPRFKQASTVDRLRLLYGLTPAEARLALCLADGCSPGEAAAQLGVRPTTVRTHLQRIYDKTGTHRQSELLLLLLTGPASPVNGRRPAAG